MIKKSIRYVVFLLIFFLLSLWLLDFNFTKKQFEFFKIKRILTKNMIAFLKKNLQNLLIMILR